MTSRPLKVFLCHAHADRDPVLGLYTRLTQDGVDAWLDKAKLLPGQDWELEIRKAVREADVVVVCLSKQFNQAGFRQKEVRLALDTAMEKPEGEIFIIPARLEECDNLESLRKWHWVDLFEDDGYEMLMRALRVRANKIGTILQTKNSRSPKVKTPSEKNVSETNGKKKNGQEMRMFYDLAAHFECDIENTNPETLANFLLESLTRIMRTVSVVNKSDDNRTIEYRTDQVEYFDPKNGKTIQHALIVHGKKLQLIGIGDFHSVESLTTVSNLLVITITQGVNGSRLRFDSDNIPVESFKELVQGILWDFGKDISALEKAEREAAEKAVREKAEKESAEKARLEVAKKVFREKTEKEVADKAWFEARELARQKAAKEKAEDEAAENTAREKAQKESRTVKEFDWYAIYLKKELKEYVFAERKKGVADKDIRATLLNAGHQKDLINEILDIPETEPAHINQKVKPFDSFHEYLKKQLAVYIFDERKKGIADKDIRDTLLEAGHQEDIISEIFNYPQERLHQVASKKQTQQSYNNTFPPYILDSKPPFKSQDWYEWYLAHKKATAMWVSGIFALLLSVGSLLAGEWVLFIINICSILVLEILFYYDKINLKK